MDSFLNPTVKGQSSSAPSMIGAELEGKQGTKVLSLFQQAGYLETNVVKDKDGKAEVERLIHFEPDSRLLTRTNGLLTPFTEPIELEGGLDTWEFLMGKFEEHRNPPLDRLGRGV